MKNIAYSKAALTVLMGMARNRRETILDHIKAIAEDMGCRPVVALKGRPGYSRLRVGDYRIIFKLSDDQATIEVTAVGPRGSIYR